MKTEIDQETTALEPYEENGEQVSSLVRLAIERGVNVEVLERLVALQERVTERSARTAFFEALAAFRDECPPITKTRDNTQFKVTSNGVQRSAKYAPLDEIDRVARPVAAAHGLVWTWDTRLEADLMHVFCRVIHTLGHSETTTVSMPVESKAGSSPQQKFGAAQTYGMRYSLIAALGLTTADEDTDGAAEEHDPATISESQEADLISLCEDVGANRAKFLSYMAVASFSDIRAADYSKAVRALESKRGKPGGG